MNDLNVFERIVADSVTSIGTPAPFEGTLDRTIARASRTRQRPRWLALIKEPPMRMSSRLAVGSPTARVAAILVATFLLTALVAGVGIAGARLLAADESIVVDQSGGGDFSTITEAVAAARDGDSILVRPGIYAEAITIDKDLRLEGDAPRDQIVIMAPQRAPIPVLGGRLGEEHETFAIYLQASDATVSDLTVRGQSSMIIVQGGAPTLERLLLDGAGIPSTAPDRASEGSSILIAGGSAAVIRDNELVGGGPIAVYDGSTPLIEGNSLTGGPHVWGIFGDATVIRGNTVEGSSAHHPSIFIWEAPGLLVEGNTITAAGRDGIGIHVGAATLRGNTISGGVTGINVNQPGTATSIADNIIEDVSQFGVSVSRGGPKLEGNTITRAGISGISVVGGEPAVTGNVLLDNAAAIAWSAPDGIIADNAVSGGVGGILLAVGSPTVTGNDIEEVEGRGLFVGVLASPTLSGNISCGNGENLVVEAGASPTIDDTNEICEDAPAE
jgi:hypothetical protein